MTTAATSMPPTAEGERRLVTVLFADLKGYTSASETADPEVMQDTLNLCFERLATEIARYGGYVDKVVGDAIMALFGAPRAQEDDAGKAIAAGLAMQRALDELAPDIERRLGKRFELRVGINSGLVVTGAVGPGGYTVTGDAVNVASRLESNAQPGTVLVGETSRRLSRRQFIWGERQELSVKNRVEPVVCFIAEGTSSSLLRLVPAPSDTPYVGRQAMLDRLHALWSGAADERVVEFAGESGIGKTRFLAHFLAQEGATADQVLYSRADTPPRTFGPLMQLLPAVHGNISRPLLDQLEGLAAAYESSSDTPVDPDWLVDGLARIIGELCTAASPLALVLDDMHRADQATVEVVEKLLPRLSALPVVVFLLRQPTGRRLRRIADVESFRLEPLADAEARALVAAAAPSIAHERADAIVTRAGGNPLYLEVLGAAAQLTPDALTVPESLQTAVVARVDDLGETARVVLREASVFGQSFPEEPLKLVTTLNEGLYDALAHLREAGLIDEMRSETGTRGYQFRHSLVQQVLYDGLLRRRRADLHRRAAEALELVHQDGIEVEPEQIGYHLRESGDTERAAAYFLAAAERADRLRAPSEARTHRRTAMRMLSMTSLADLYAAQRRPTVSGRVVAGALQLAVAVALVLPFFVLLATRRPSPDVMALGLPTEIVQFNIASVLVASAIGGVPLLIAGIAFAHLAAPALMRRTVPLVTMALCVAGGWALGLLAVVLGYAALVGLLRMGWLDRLSSIYVGASTLRLMLGDYSLAVTAALGTLAVSFAWTMLLRLQASGWTRTRRGSISPKQVEAGRRYAAVGQVALLLDGAGIASLLGVASYQFNLLPNSDVQPDLPSSVAGGLIAFFGLVAVGAFGALLWARMKLRKEAPDYRAGLFGFEVPLISALAFGLVLWFGMRQEVVVAANEVDTPGDIATFSRAVDLFPELGLAYYMRGERYLAEVVECRDPGVGCVAAERAHADFTRAIELDPEFPASYLARGRVLVMLNQPDAAIADATKLVELRPDHPGGYAIRAMAHAAKGDLAAAGADLELATRPLPENLQSWDAYFIRCIVLVTVQRAAEAKADCERVLEINPRQIVTLDQLMQIAFAQDDFEAALGYVNRILAINDTNALAWSNRASINSRLERWEDAERDATRAIELDDTDVSAHQVRATANLFLDRPEEAMADANRAAELAPEELFIRLYVSRYTGDRQQAIADATAMLSMVEPSSYLLSARGLVYVQTGNAEAGLADLNAALEVGDDGAAWDRRGYAKFLLGDLEGAIADLDEALRRLPALGPQSRAEIYYHRALVNRAAGLIDVAREEVDEALAEVRVPSVRREIEALRAELEAQP